MQSRPSQPFSTSSPAYSEPIVPFSQLPFSFLQRLSKGIAFIVVALVGLLVLHAVDLFYFLANLVTPSRANGRVTPPAFSPANPPSPISFPFTFIVCVIANRLGKKACPSFLWAWAHWKGVEGELRLEETDSRSPCPALNALANTGALARNGRNITQAQLSAAISRAYNLAPTLAVQLGLPFSPLFEGRGMIDLEDISACGLVQHDGSTVREDVNSPFAHATVAATQGKPSLRLVSLYYPEEAEKEEYTYQNMAAILAHARRTSRSVNGSFYLTLPQYIFSSGNVALTHATIGGKVSDLRAWFGATPPGVEGFQGGFESKSRQAWGISILQAQLFTFLIELTCGPLSNKPRELATKGNDVEAFDGWVAMKGEAGTKQE